MDFNKVSDNVRAIAEAMAAQNLTHASIMLHNGKIDVSVDEIMLRDVVCDATPMFDGEVYRLCYVCGDITFIAMCIKENMANHAFRLGGNVYWKYSLLD